MANIWDILFTLGLMALGLIAGYYYRNMNSHGLGKSEDEIDQLRRRFQVFALLVVNPVAFGGAIWALDISDLRIIALPFLGAFAISIGGFLAYIAAKLMKLSRQQIGDEVGVSVLVVNTPSWRIKAPELARNAMSASKAMAAPLQ